MTLLKTCIIGAGCSGITTAKRLKDHGLAFDCFEMSDDIGGNWYFKNPNGRSACYQSLHIDTSKWRLAFEDYPVPADWPDFPHHSQLLGYFRDYARHFGLYPLITFNTEVKKAVRGQDGVWSVTLSNGETRRYGALIVCNGHHWDPRTPTYEGTFNGPAFHVHSYRDPFDPVDMRGKNIVVVGMGNSAMDVASELSQRPIAKNLWVSARRGVWVLPKYLNGKPADKAAGDPRIPRFITQALARNILKKAIGRMEDYGLPKPDHELLTAHPSVSGEFLTRVGCGDIKMKPAIQKLDGDHVIFADGSREAVDVIVYATGYNMRFPFFDDPRLNPDAEHRFPLYKRMLHADIPNVIFMGLAQPLPTLVNLAEQQSKLVVKLLDGSYRPPPPEEMRRITAKDEAYYLGPYYKSARHTIQVDFAHYVMDLMKEIARGEKRAGVRQAA